MVDKKSGEERTLAMKTGNCNPRALRVALAVHERQNPQATILFGSRIREDHEDLRSDIDIMSVLPEEPGSEHREPDGPGKPSWTPTGPRKAGHASQRGAVHGEQPGRPDRPAHLT